MNETKRKWHYAVYLCIGLMAMMASTPRTFAGIESASTVRNVRTLDNEEVEGLAVSEANSSELLMVESGKDDTFFTFLVVLGVIAILGLALAGASDSTEEDSSPPAPLPSAFQ